MTIEEKIWKFLKKELKISEPSIETMDYKIDPSRMDSLGRMRLVFFLESEFNLTISIEEVAAINPASVSDISIFVKSKLQIK